MNIYFQSILSSDKERKKIKVEVYGIPYHLSFSKRRLKVIYQYNIKNLILQFAGHILSSIYNHSDTWVIYQSPFSWEEDEEGNMVSDIYDPYNRQFRGRNLLLRYKDLLVHVCSFFDGKVKEFHEVMRRPIH
jgi:hypothetical protein